MPSRPPLHNLTPLGRRLLRGFFAFLFVLLAIYLVNGLLDGDIRYGTGIGRMSRNSNVVHNDTPFALFVATLHLGSLLFAFGAMAVKHEWFLRRHVWLPTVALFVASHVILLAINNA